MSQEQNSSSLTSVDTSAGTQMTVIPTREFAYKTSSGQNLYNKILTGSHKILFPTCVDVNSCFEYRFSVKELMLPDELPKVTDLYFSDLTVKFQDCFTQVVSDDAIKNGIAYAYDPFSAVICQDENGLEFQDQNLKTTVIGEDGQQKEVIKKYKCIASSRVIQRDDNALFVVSSNLRVEKHINITNNSGNYKVLVLSNVYDKDGNFVKKHLESVNKVSVEQLRQCLNFQTLTKEEIKGKKICIDIILCDILVFMMKSCNLSTGSFLEDLKPNQLQGIKTNKTLPIGWLTPEEKLQRFGKKGTFMDTFSSNKEGDGDVDVLSNDLFVHTDMQEVCSKVFAVGRPKSSVFDDKKGIIAGYHCQFAIAHQLISVSVQSDN